MVRPGRALAEILDGATGDYAVSGDAMRWSPELAEQPARTPPGDLPGVDVAAGLGSLLGLDGAGVRRLVSGALYSLSTAASDVVGELRQLTRGPSDGDDGVQEGRPEPRPDDRGQEQRGEA